MAYENIGKLAEPVNFTYARAETAQIRPSPESPKALTELAAAATNFSEAAERYIFARDALTDARQRWDAALDLTAKLREKEGV